MAWADTDDGGYGEFGGGYSSEGGQDGQSLAGMMQEAWGNKQGYGWGPPQGGWTNQGWGHGGWSAPFGSQHPGTGTNPGPSNPGVNMGNIEGVPAGAYGPGPLDPMSAWGGPAWGPGVGQPAPGTGPYGVPATGTGYPGATAPTSYGGQPFGNGGNYNEGGR